MSLLSRILILVSQAAALLELKFIADLAAGADLRPGQINGQQISPLVAA